jgi:predicted membrane metal-binding protein
MSGKQALRDMHERLDDGGDIVRGSSDSGFGLVFAAVFAVVALWPVVFGASGPHWWAAGIAGLFLALALLAPRILAPLNRLWLKFGLLLHRVVNPLVMGLLFFVVLTPMGLVARALGHDFLRRRRDATADSYWLPRQPPGPAPDTMRNQF